MAVHKIESLRLFTPVQDSCFLSSVTWYLKKLKSALAMPSSYREIIKKYIISILKAHFLQLAACTYNDGCAIIGRLTAKYR